jgi:hypothetical protein
MKNIGRRNFLGAALAGAAALAVGVSTLPNDPEPIPEECPFDWSMVSTNATPDLMIYDADGDPGEFTKKLVSLMKEVMKRQENQHGEWTN